VGTAATRKLLTAASARARHFEVATVDSPFGNGTDHPLRNVDVLTLLYRRKLIDARELEAAVRLRTALENVASGLHCALASEPGSIPAGSRSPPPKALLAASLLREAAALLGVTDSCVTRAIVGEGFSISAAAVRLYGSDKQRRIVSDRLRSSLRVLADHWFERERPRHTHAHRSDGAVPHGGNASLIAYEQLAGAVAHAGRRGWTR